MVVLGVADKVPWRRQVVGLLLPAPSVMLQGRLVCGLVPEIKVLDQGQVMG